jgi:hypothetical protein
MYKLIAAVNTLKKNAKTIFYEALLHFLVMVFLKKFYFPDDNEIKSFLI